jgi:hypothetical protein
MLQRKLTATARTALGHERPLGDGRTMSALPLKATGSLHFGDRRNGPITTEVQCSKMPPMEVRSLSDKQCHPLGQNAKSSSRQAEIKAVRRFGSDRGASFPGSRSIFRRRTCSSLASYTVAGDSNEEHVISE